MRAGSLLAALALPWAAVAFAAAPKQFSWSLDSMDVEGRGDSLAVTLVWSFHNWEIAPQKAVVLSPSLRNGERFASLTPVSVYGRRAALQPGLPPASGVAAERSVTDLTEPVTLRVEDVIPYSEWMDTVRVSLSVSEWSRRDGLVLRSNSQRGVFVRPARPADPEFPWAPFEPAPEPDGFIDLSYSVPVSFPEGSSKFEISLQDTDLWEGFVSKVKAFSSSGDFAVRSSSLELTVPPTGISKESVKLSVSRVKSVYSFLAGSGCFRYEKADRVGGGDDWDGVREWVSRSRFVGDERLMEILSWEGKNDAKAGALRDEKPVIWEMLSESCFPSLGRVEYIVYIRRPQFADPGFVEPFYESVPETLSAHDFWYLSTLYEVGSPQWRDIVCTGAGFHPEDRELNLDAAFALMDAGRLNAASEYLRNAGMDDRARYAYAVWLYRMDRYDESIRIMEQLRRRSVVYGPVMDAAVPFIRWQKNLVKWERYYP